jgi:tetratricopeptide (TPR) repeat protein
MRRHDTTPAAACRRRAGRFFLAGLLAAASLAGCASHEEHEYSTMTDEPLDEFDLGADSPPSEKTLLALAKVLSSQKNDEQAQFVLLRVIREYPKCGRAYSELAQLYLRNERRDKSLEALAAGLRALPEDAVLLNNLGVSLLLSEDYEEASECFTRAVAEDPKNARYRANLALSLGFLGRDDEALAVYRQVLPESEARHNLSVIHELAKPAAPEAVVGGVPAAEPVAGETAAETAETGEATVPVAGETAETAAGAAVEGRANETTGL